MVVAERESTETDQFTPHIRGLARETNRYLGEIGRTGLNMTRTCQILVEVLPEDPKIMDFMSQLAVGAVLRALSSDTYRPIDIPPSQKIIEPIGDEIDFQTLSPTTGEAILPTK